MSEQNTVVETLQIADLEYDVAGVGATEEANADCNFSAHFVVSYRLPE